MESMDNEENDNVDDVDLRSVVVVVVLAGKHQF